MKVQVTKRGWQQYFDKIGLFCNKKVNKYSFSNILPSKVLAKFELFFFIWETIVVVIPQAMLDVLSAFL